jgi:hypothetical protein
MRYPRTDGCLSPVRRSGQLSPGRILMDLIENRAGPSSSPAHLPKVRSGAYRNWLRNWLGGIGVWVGSVGTPRSLLRRAYGA